MTTVEPDATRVPDRRFPAGPPPRPRRWIVAVVVGWAALLAGALIWGVVRGEPTAREQSTVAQARPVVDRASAELATAAADGLAVVAVSAFERVDTCTVTVVRDGARYRRVVTALVTPGTEQALLERVAARLPVGYGAWVRKGAVPRLAADAGFFVAISGTVSEPGRVDLVADTGTCRPVGDLDPSGSQRSAPAGPGVGVLDRLGVTTAEWTTHTVPCPNGGQLTTVAAVATEGSVSDPLDDRLRSGSPEPVVATSDLYAYTDGGAGVAVRFDGPRAVVTTTTVCR